MSAARALSPGARRSALLIAVAADAIQLGVLPLFAGGSLSPLNAALDVVVGFLLVRRLGWHFALLPTFAAEMLPAVDLFPTWTAAAWFVARSRASGVSEPQA